MLVPFGQTTHFIVEYDTATGSAGLSAAYTLLALCESDLTQLASYMPYHMGGAGDFFVDPKVKIQVLNDPLNGPPLNSAKNDGFHGTDIPKRASVIKINPYSATGTAITSDYAGFLFVAEMAEILMAIYRWDSSSSQGEALSRVMAEELHPASSSNWVNAWLSWPRPRPDWISRNEATTPLVRADLDQVAYGCGIIFIYFLRYQLGRTYDEICTTAPLLSDSYKKVTGATDDPATRVGALLDAHFGSGKINLVGNNPFPLYEGADRRVLLAFSKPSATSHMVRALTGIAHVQPFFNCPVADYPYHAIASNVTQTITATTIGIGLPSFKWRINGKSVVAPGEKGVDVISPVDVPDPQDLTKPKHQTETLTFDCQIGNGSTGTSSSLTITNQTFGGDYLLDIHVEADETAKPSAAVSADQTLTLQTRGIVYGGTYGDDRKRCIGRFEEMHAAKMRPILSHLSNLKNLPDPPPTDYVERVVEAVTALRREIAAIESEDPKSAHEIARFAADQLKVRPGALLDLRKEDAPPA